MPGRLLRVAQEGAELTQGLGDRLHGQRRRRGPGEQAGRWRHVGDECLGRGALAEASRRMPDWQAAPSVATAAPLVSALTEHRAALLEHLHDEEEYILPLIEEHLTVAEWARLGQRFAEEVPKDKMLFFLGMILEDADPAERQAMMANLPAPARFVWKAFGQRQWRRRVSKIRAGLGRS